VIENSQFPTSRDLVDMTVYRAEVDGDTFAALDQSQEFWIYAIRRAWRTIWVRL